VTVDEGNSQVEPAVECPYCGVQIFRRALFGHVSSANDTDHGARGIVPDDYSEQTPNIVEYVQVGSRAELELSGSRILCRYCFKTFDGKHGLNVHIGMKRGDEDHPEDTTVEKARLPLSIYGEIEPSADEPPTEPPAEAAEPEQNADLSDYRSRLKSMTRAPGEGTSAGAESVPTEPLLELLNDYREREGESGAYVTAARMLQDVLEEHGALNP